MDISIIAAIAKNRTIGFRGDLPWRKVKEITKPDLKHFQDLTIGNPVIMGKNTFYSIPKKYRPLKERENIVLSKSNYFKQDSGVIQAKSLEEAFRYASVTGSKELFIMGGESVFREAMEKYAQKMYLTEINIEFPGDIYFPKFNLEEWKVIDRECHDLFDFVTYQRNYFHS